MYAGYSSITLGTCLLPVRELVGSTKVMNVGYFGFYIVNQATPITHSHYWPSMIIRYTSLFTFSSLSIFANRTDRIVLLTATRSGDNYHRTHTTRLVFTASRNKSFITFPDEVLGKSFIYSIRSGNFSRARSLHSKNRANSIKLGALPPTATLTNAQTASPSLG